MIEDYEKFRIIDAHGRDSGLTVEVNWNPEDEKTNKCKVLKLTFPDGKRVFIKKEHLFSLLFVIGSKSEQRKMIPQRITNVRHYVTTMYIKLKTDTRKGDVLKVPVNISLPSVSEEVYAELKKEKRIEKGNKSILPSSGIVVPEYIKRSAKSNK